jgi:mutator protein MutT
MNTGSIHKAGGLLIQDRKFLLERHGGNDTYIVPGGKLEAGETSEQALIRELREEFGLAIKERNLQALGSFESQAVHNPQSIVTIDMFLVKEWEGEMKLDDGIEGMIWVDAANVHEINVSSITTNHVIPLLQQMGLID